MLEFVYLLEALIPNFGDMIEVIGGAFMIFGLVDAFLGYKQFKLMIAITGFLTGAVAGFLIFLNGGNGGADIDALRIYMLVGGIIGAALAGTFHKVGVFLVVGAMSAIVFLLITQNTPISLLLGAACGIAGVFIEKYIVIIATALSGGDLAAMGIWLIGIANGDNMNFLAMSLVISICGLVFQLWLEKRNPTKAEAEAGIGIVDIIVIIFAGAAFFVASVVKNPKEAVHKFIYKRDSDEISLALICCSLGLPIVVGAIPGILFHSINLASGGIAALYILWMAIYVKKRKAEVMPGGYVPKHKWEVWLNQVMDSQAFLISVLFLMPFFPGFFILGLTASFIDNDGIILLMTLIGIVGTFVVWFKILGGLPPKEADDSHSEEDTGTAQRSGGIKEELESGLDIHGKISMAACPSCGKKINENAKFCNYCGKEITDKTQTGMITCGNCGKSIAKDANFCVFCGEKNIGKDN